MKERRFNRIEAAEFLGISKGTLSKIVKNGELTSIPQTKPQRFNLSALLAYQRKQSNIINQQILGISLYPGESFKPINLHTLLARKKPLQYNTSSLYVVSNYGRVFNFYTGKELSQCETAHGYLQVSLATPTGKTFFRVHELVAASWCDNKHGYTIPHHIDGNPKNNRVENIVLLNKRKHDYAHSLLREAKETGDKTKYNFEIKKFQEDNKTNINYSCYPIEKDKSVTFVWMPKNDYDLLCQNKISLEEIELSTANFKVVSKERLT